MDGGRELGKMVALFFMNLVTTSYTITISSITQSMQMQMDMPIHGTMELKEITGTIIWG